MADLKPSAQRVQDALQAAGFGCQVVELPDSTRTAAEAAAAVGCAVEQIAKSLIFAGSSSGQAFLVIAGGGNRVDEKKVSALSGEKIVRAGAEFVRAQTGYVIGGVPPIGHPSPLRTWIDADLLSYTAIWAAAGHPHAVFCLTPADLVAMTGGVVAEVKAAVTAAGAR
ncbi:MAG: YbaK/EbsC family protein [Caldilinea sp.]|nr:YbaK/EbsC family protein [Caldilinea sp.]